MVEIPKDSCGKEMHQNATIIKRKKDRYIIDMINKKRKNI